MHAAAKWLNALSTGSPRQPAEFHRPLTSLADYLFAIPSLLLPSLPPSLPSSVLLQLPSPTPTAPGKQWRGGSLLWEGDMERKAGSEQEGDVREKRQSCCHTKQSERKRRGAGKRKDKDLLPLPALVDNDTRRVISKQWARKRRAAAAIHPPKHNTQSPPCHNHIHLWENSAGLITCMAEHSCYI